MDLDVVHPQPVLRTMPWQATPCSEGAMSHAAARALWPGAILVRARSALWPGMAG
jgi:hypothetical protein